MPVGTQLMYRTQLVHSDPFEPTEDRVYWVLIGDTLGGRTCAPRPLRYRERVSLCFAPSLEAIRYLVRDSTQLIADSSAGSWAARH